MIFPPHRYLIDAKRKNQKKMKEQKKTSTSVWATTNHHDIIEPKNIKVDPTETGHLWPYWIFLPFIFIASSIAEHASQMLMCTLRNQKLVNTTYERTKGATLLPKYTAPSLKTHLSSQLIQGEMQMLSYSFSQTLSAQISFCTVCSFSLKDRK